MISGQLDRRRRALALSTIASAAIHLIVLTLLFAAVAHMLIARGEKEVVSRTELVTIKKEALPTPAPPRPHRRTRPILQRQSTPAITPRHEIAVVTKRPAPRQPVIQTPKIPSKLERDEAGFSREVAQLNSQNDPHAIPTIDPASRESPTKSYAFDVSSTERGDKHGNGIITPTRSWEQGGLNCYYGRYEYTYPDGAMESGDIVWPFCFEPGSDPFKQPPHPIPFPLPLVGFKLPPDADMPPIEKQIYQQWAGATNSSP